MQREPENNQSKNGMAADGEFDDFASAMQDVQPLSPSKGKGKGKSKGKQTFAAPQRLSAEEGELIFFKACARMGRPYGTVCGELLDCVSRLET